MTLSSPRTQGHTLLETVTSTVLVTVLVLALASVSLPIQRATVYAGIARDQDRAASLVLNLLGRDLRQSGLKADGTEMITTPGHGSGGQTPQHPAAAADIDLVDLQVRIGPDAWSSSVIYRAVADGVFEGTPTPINRYKLIRIQDGLSVGLAENVSKMGISWPAGGSTVLGYLELTAASPDLVDGKPGLAITRRYELVVEFQNPSLNPGGS